MGNVIQAQEIVEKATERFVSCTPRLPGTHYHQRRSDFYKICKGDWVSADALRVAENETNRLIKELRRRYRIPLDCLPHEDDLWFSARLQDFEYLSAESTKRSTFARCLHEVSAKKNKPSLIQLGFFAIRFVAWAGLDPELPDTMIYRGKRDGREESFIIVDANGEYVDSQGKKRNAIEEGWPAIEKQFRFEIEAVNKALAKLAGQSPPKPMQRWHSLQKRKATTSETTKSTASNGQNVSSQQTSAQTPNDDESEKGKAGSTLLFANKNNIDLPGLSLENTENRLNIVGLNNNSTVLLSAPWCAETVIALVSQLLVVPDRDTIDEEQWRRDWLQPAQWLIDFTADLDCARAWEIIEQYVWAMIAGPTWHAREANKPFLDYGTLRHVVGWNKTSGALDGHNWKSTADALRKEQWKGYEPTAYRGPALFSDDQSAYSSSAQTEQPSLYAQGYTAQTLVVVEGTTQPLPDDSQSEETAQTEYALEVTAQSSSAQCDLEDSAQDNEQAAQSMESEDAQCAMGTETAMQIAQGFAKGMKPHIAAALRDQIWDEYPDISIAKPQLPSGLYLVAMEVALDTWYYLGSIADWNDPTPETQLAIDAAEAYGQQRNASDGNGGHDSQGPPGYGEVSEGGDASW